MSGHKRLTEEQLHALPTPRLVTYYKKHYRADYMAWCSDEDLNERQLKRRNYQRLVRRIMNARKHVET